MDSKGKSRQKGISKDPATQAKTANKGGDIMAVKVESTKGTVAKSAPAVAYKAKTADKAEVEQLDNSEKTNLNRLAKSPIIMNFVKSKNGCWNHHDWLEFLSDVKKKGFDPVRPDQVGMLLEEKKAQYLAARNS